MPGTKGPLWGEQMLEGTEKEGTVTSPYDIMTEEILEWHYDIPTEENCSE